MLYLTTLNKINVFMGIKWLKLVNFVPENIKKDLKKYGYD